MTTMTGKQFKKAYPTTRFYKLTNENEKHNGFLQLKDGLNINPITFKYTGEYSCGGVNFTDRDNISRMFILMTECQYIREVEILDDSWVYINKCKFTKFTADKFILKPRILLRDFDLWNDYKYCKKAVLQNYNALIFVKDEHKTEEIYKLALKRNGLALEYVKDEDKTPELCNFAVQCDWHALQFVKDEHKTEEIYKLAINQNGYALQFVKKEHKTKELCDLAVKQNEDAIRYANNYCKLCFILIHLFNGDIKL